MEILLRPLTLGNNDLTARQDWLVGQKQKRGGGRMNVEKFKDSDLSVAIR